jgi:hypothetical protein
MMKTNERKESTYSVNMTLFKNLLGLPDEEEILDVRSKISQGNNGMSKRVIIVTNKE